MVTVIVSVVSSTIVLVRRGGTPTEIRVRCQSGGLLLLDVVDVEAPEEVEVVGVAAADVLD